MTKRVPEPFAGFYAYAIKRVTRARPGR